MEKDEGRCIWLNDACENNAYIELRDVGWTTEDFAYHAPAHGSILPQDIPPNIFPLRTIPQTFAMCCVYVCVYVYIVYMYDT